MTVTAIEKNEVANIGVSLMPKISWASDLIGEATGIESAVVYGDLDTEYFYASERETVEIIYHGQKKGMELEVMTDNVRYFRDPSNANKGLAYRQDPQCKQAYLWVMFDHS